MTLSPAFRCRSWPVSFALVFLGIANQVSAAASDKQAPTVPTNLVSSAISMTGFTVSWTASTDNVGVTAYEVFLGGTSQGTVTTTSKVFTGLVPGTTYSVTIRARDAAANWSAQSAALSVVTLADTMAPSVPTGLAASGVSTTGFTVNWTAATDNVGVTGYEVFLGGVSQGTVTAPTKNFTGLQSGSSYAFTVRARDAAGNWSAQSTALSVTTISDTAAPSVPTGLVASGVTSSAFTINWTASTDNVGVTGYEVYLDGSSQGTVTTTTKAFSGLQPSTTYSVAVRALDGAGNWSAQSAVLPVTTSVGPPLNYALSVGEYIAVAVKPEGTAWAWGGSYGSSTPVQLSGVSSGKSGVAGAAHILILRQDGTVVATGDNSRGQIGDGTLTTPISRFTGIAALGAGKSHSLAVKTDGTLYGWGANEYGQVGNGRLTDEPSPVKLSQITGVTSVAAGQYHSLALKSNGTVLAWGYNASGQVGNGSTANQTSPMTVTGLTSVVAVAAGGNHSLAIKADGTVWTWGENTFGQLGDSTATNRSVPVQVTGLAGVTAIAAGVQHSLARKSDGSLWAWGANAFRQLGDGSRIDRAVPTRVTLVNTAPVAAAGGDASFAVMSDGTIRSWGSFKYNLLGDGGSGIVAIPFDDVLQLNRLRDELVLRRDGTVWGWGLNEYGGLGDGTRRPRMEPEQIPGLTNVVQIDSNIALRGDGTVWTWGDNNYGQLGDGTTNERLTPGIVLGLTGVTKVVSTYDHCLAMKVDGSVWAWGRNHKGQIGDGTVQQRNTPVPVPGFSNAVDIEVIEGGSWIVRSDGSVWYFGKWTWGSGTDTGVDSLVPTQCAINGVTRIASHGHTLFLTQSGSVYICGQNALGVGSIFGSPTPLQIPGLQNIVEVSCGAGKAVRSTGGRVWVWTDDNPPQILEKVGIANPTQIRSASGMGLVYLDGSVVFWSDLPSWMGVPLRPAGFTARASQVANFRFLSTPSDSDSDGLPDAWEIQHFGNLTHTASADDDNDGLTNIQEYLRGTSPILANADGDRFPDSTDELPADYYNGVAPLLSILGGNNQQAEVNKYNAAPFDVAAWTSDAFRPLVNAPVVFTVASGGGLLALDRSGAAPGVSSINLSADVDGTARVYYKQPSAAGVTSAIQVVAGTTQVAFTSSSIAALPDSDGNGLSDPWELQYFGQLGVDPNADPDGDGLTNLQESQQGTSPIDYYNGVLPVITSLVNGNQPGSQGLISVKVTAEGGAILVNAPVTFAIVSGVNQIAATPSGALSTQMVVTSNAQGVASVYVDGGFLITAEAISTKAISGTQNVLLFLSLNPPASVDSDQNGLPDWWEMKYFAQLGVNPSADPDNDGATNAQEYQRGTSPLVLDTAPSSSAALRIFTPLNR